MHLLSTRPSTGAAPDPIADALRAAGHQVTQAPLISVSFCGTMPSLDGVQAIIATSRNGLRAVEPVPNAALALPLFAVGPATAALGRGLGFRHVIEGPGSARELQALISEKAKPSAGALLHLAADTLAFDLRGALVGQGFAVRTEIVYKTEPAGAFPGEVADAFRQGAYEAVVLMSPRTAKVYAALVDGAGLAAAARRMAHFCLSGAVGRELAPLGAVRIAVARSPNSQEMLALITRDASESS